MRTTRHAAVTSIDTINETWQWIEGNYITTYKAISINGPCWTISFYDTMTTIQTEGYNGKYSEMVANVIDKLIRRENPNTEE